MTSLKDYISKENNEIVEQFRYFNRLDKILKNLSKKSQHEEMKISKCHQDDDENIPAKNKSPSADHKNETPKNQKDDDQTKTNLDLEKMLENLPILKPKTAPSKSATSQMEKYRQDLLKQIQEKKISKKTNEELEKNKEKILQNKIKQQQISLYLEYLDERKKMKNFIPKQRPPSSTKIMMVENDRKNAIQMKQKCKSAKADHRKHEKDANEKNNINSLNEKMDIPNDDDSGGGGEQSSSNDSTSLMKIQEKG